MWQLIIIFDLLLVVWSIYLEVVKMIIMWTYRELQKKVTCMPVPVARETPNHCCLTLQNRSAPPESTIIIITILFFYNDWIVL